MNNESLPVTQTLLKRRFAYALAPIICALFFAKAFLWLSDRLEFTSPLHSPESNDIPQAVSSSARPAVGENQVQDGKLEQTLEGESGQSENRRLRGAYEELPTDFKMYYEDSVRRAVWGIMSHALLCSIFLSAACSVLSIVNCLSDTGYWRWVTLALALLCAAVGWKLVQNVPLSGGVGGALYDLAMKRSAHQFDVGKTMSNLMGNVVAASTLVVFSCACICFASARIEKKFQLKLYRIFQFNMGMTALFLCIGTIQTFALYEWLTTFLVEVPVNGSPNKEYLHAYVSGESVVPMIKRGMTLAVSFFYTVCFGIVFLPTYLIFKEGAVDWARSEIGVRSHGAAMEFLAKHGIQFKARNLLNVLTVLSSPLIVSVVTEVLK